MSGKKIIELQFGKDKKPIISIVKQATVPETSVKTYEFGTSKNAKLVLEVSSSKEKKPVLVEKSAVDKVETKIPENPNTSQCVSEPKTSMQVSPSGAIPKPSRQEKLHQPQQQQQYPHKQQIKIQDRGVDDKNHPSVQQKVEPPPVTEADLAIFRQFMTFDRPAPPAHENKQILLGKNYVITNQEDFVCSLCEDFIVKRRGVVLKRCQHNFCIPCIVKHIKDDHDEQLNVKCPFPFNPCESMLEDEEVKDLIPEAEYLPMVLEAMQKLEATLREKERLEQIANGTLPDLVQVDDRAYIENYEVFECQICFTDAEIGEGVVLKKCQHKFCKECLIESVKHSEDFEVKCPHNDPVEGNCKEFFTEREIRNLVPPEIFDKHLEKALKLFEGTNAQKTTHCLTPDCNYFLEHDKNLRGFKCIVCSAVNCIGCKAIHKDKNCREYQDEVNPGGRLKREDEDSAEAIRQMVANKEAMYCPRCRIPVMKTVGCDFITCTTCKLGICWVTQKPRKPITLENGTFIDGCHCREGGDQYRCHPNCGFCH